MDKLTKLFQRNHNKQTQKVKAEVVHREGKEGHGSKQRTIYFEVESSLGHVGGK